MMTAEQAAGQRVADGVVRVLIADDQPEHQAMIARALEASRHHGRLRIVRADDGLAALENIKDVHLVFLDIQMPGRTGFEILRETRGGPRPPVVIVSSSADPRDVAEAQKLGAFAYVEKGRFPAFRDRIVAVLDAVLDGKAL